VAALGVFAVRQIITQALAPPPIPTPQGPITEKVVVVSRDLPIGSLLAAEDLRTVDMPVELMPRDVFTDELEVVGRIITAAMVDGEMVLRHNVANPTNVSHDLAFVIGDDQVLMAFPATDLMSGLNVLQRGDLVDILVSIDKTVELSEIDPDAPEQDTLVTQTTEEGEPVTRMFTFDAMQAVEISAVIAEITYEENRTLGPLASTAEEATEDLALRQPSSVKVKAFLLALSPQDALVLKHLMDIGGVFDIVLRSSAPPIYFDLDPVIDEYIIEKYELEVIK
jgi:Flp pilus assembly protein CpaB